MDASRGCALDALRDIGHRRDCRPSGQTTAYDDRRVTMQGLARDLVAGSLSGTVATLAMSGLMLTGQRAGLLGKQPPRKISDAMLDRLFGREPGEQPRRWMTAVVHLGIGAGAGGLHQVGRRMAARPQPAVLWGGAAGATLWALAYWVVAPVVGLLPPPDRDRPGRPQVMLASHVLWGALSAALGDRLARRRGRPHRQRLP